MGGKGGQRVQGGEKGLEGGAAVAMLEKFVAFPEIQVIDLDAAIGHGSNDALVELLASRAKCRVGGGVRSAERTRALVEQGAHTFIVATAAFNPSGANADLLANLSRESGRGRLFVAVHSSAGQILTKGSRQATD